MLKKLLKQLSRNKISDKVNQLDQDNVTKWVTNSQWHTETRCNQVMDNKCNQVMDNRCNQVMDNKCQCNQVINNNTNEY